VYLRYAALGDSVTVGLGDPVRDGWRGWSRLLAQSLSSGYDVSYCNTAVVGSTAPMVLREQLDDAVAHRPDLASLIVGINDILRSTWDPMGLRADLFACAEALTGVGARLLTVRFHDHGEVVRVPGWLHRPLTRRVGVVNDVYDEIHATYGGIRVDLGQQVLDRSHWSIDRFHPSERGHRGLARAFAEQLTAEGWAFTPPATEPSGGVPATRLDQAQFLVTEVPAWFGRRARDLGPWAVRTAWDAALEEGRQRRRRAPVMPSA
jgi:lysophospholipase L1-like esterase